MYNEVYKNCPHCGTHCEIQISQIVDGFGCFSLDDPEFIDQKLPNKSDRKTLLDLVDDEPFWCGKCKMEFNMSDCVFKAEANSTRSMMEMRGWI